MVVYVDYAVKAVQDSQMLHDAPMIRREAGSFAYNEGLIFEGELLQKGGKKMAFAGAFTRPPKNSHEILQPEAYINAEKLPSTTVPDLKQLIGGEYEVFESGGIGQLDVRAYLKQYGERRSADDISSAWQGGAYAAFRRKKVAGDAVPNTSDLATIYVSRWKTSQAARFARFYASTVAKRYQTATAQDPVACSGQKGPVASAQYLTEEGPVVVEQWADNSVIVSESFDSNVAVKIGDTVHDSEAGTQAENIPQVEIGLGMYEFPAFRAFAQRMSDEIARALQTDSLRVLSSRFSPPHERKAAAPMPVAFPRRVEYHVGSIKNHNPGQTWPTSHFVSTEVKRKSPSLLKHRFSGFFVTHCN